MEKTTIDVNGKKLLQNQIKYMNNENSIKVGDIVLHTLSGLYYKCENKKHQKWMQINPFYKVVTDKNISDNYFKKSFK